MLAVEQLAFNDLAGVRHADFQFLDGFAELAATGCGKQDDLLSGEVVLLQEGIDDSGGDVPYADKIIMPTSVAFVNACNISFNKHRHYIFRSAFNVEPHRFHIRMPQPFQPKIRT